MSVFTKTTDLRVRTTAPDGSTHLIGSYGSRDSRGDNSPRDSAGKLLLRENKYYSLKHSRLDELLQVKRPSTGQTFYASSNGYLPVPTIPLWGPSNDLELLTRLITKIRQNDFNLFAFMGEGYQSLQMIGDTTKRLQDAMLAASKKQGRKVRRILKMPSSKVGSYGDSFSEYWLAYSFGWAPLVSDIVSAAKALYDITNKPMYCEYRAYVKQPLFPDETRRLHPAVGIREPVGFRYTSVRVRFPAPIPQYIHQGLFAGEVAGWQLLPWSFLVDTFIPIGDYLSVTGLLARLPQEGKYWKGVSTFYSVNPPYVANPKSTERVYDASAVKAHSRYVHVTRDPWIVNQAYVPLPRFIPLGEALTWKRTADMVALFISQKARLRLNAVQHFKNPD